MYDPTTARFLQEDTYTGDTKDPLSLNLYTYCHNKPLMYWDPSGHKERGQVLSEGASGDDIILLQKMLVQAGYLKMPQGTPYGYFGGLTKQALENWQSYKGLDVDGALGDNSWTSLGLLFEGDPNYNLQYGEIIDRSTQPHLLNDQEYKIVEGSFPGDVKNKIYGAHYDTTKTNWSGIETQKGKYGVWVNPTITAKSQQLKEQDRQGEIHKYLPIVSTINNIKIAATGMDLSGHGYNEGERYNAKGFAIGDISFIVIGGIGSIFKSPVEAAATNVAESTLSNVASQEVKDMAKQVLKQPLRDPVTGRFVKKPWTQLNNALKNVTATTQDITQEALFTSMKEQAYKEFLETDNGGGVLDAFSTALKIGVKNKTGGEFNPIERALEKILKSK